MNYRIFKTDLKPWLKKFFFEKFSYIIKVITGTIITITDGIRKKVNELKMSKESTQEITTGKNLFDYNYWKTHIGITRGTGVFENNGISITSTGSDCYTDYGSGRFGNNLKVEEGDTIILSWEETENKEGTIYLFPNASVTGAVNVHNEDVKQLEYTVPSGVTFITFRFGVKSSDITIKYKNIMVRKNGTTSDYEPYTNGPSPNPNYPQEVKTVKGYRNLLDLTNAQSQESNGVKITVNSDKSITLYGTSTSAITYDVAISDINLSSSKTYLISQSNSYYGSRYAMSLRDSSYGIVDSSCSLDSSKSNKEFTVSTDKVAKYIRLYIPNNTALDTTIYPMILEGTTIKPYVPYGSNYIYTTVCGKNIFNGKIELGSISPSNGETSSSTGRTRSVDFIKVKPNTTYTFTRQGGNYRWVVGYTKDKVGVTDGTIAGQPAGLYNAVASLKTFQFTTTPTTEYIKWYDTSYTNVNEEVQIEIGSHETTTYEAYKENIITLPLNNNEVCGISTYKDELIVDKNGKCWLNKKIGKAVLDGTENWSKSISQGYLINATINTPFTDRNTGVYKGFCNYFKFNENSTTWTALYSCGFNSSNVFWVKENNTIADTLDGWKAWLSTHNPEVYYPLATANLIDLNYTVDIRLFKGTNNISNFDDMDMSIKYYSK